MQSIAKALQLISKSACETNPVMIRIKQNNAYENNKICPCCFGAISGETLELLAQRVIQAMAQRDANSSSASIPVCIEVTVPPIMDAIRITARTVITRHAEKLFPFPAVEELVLRVLTMRLRNDLNIVPAADAKVKV